MRIMAYVSILAISVSAFVAVVLAGVFIND